jgi:general secretion pathway protein M
MSLADRFAEMSPRERRLLSALGVIFVVLFVFLVPFLIGSSLRSSREENAKLRDAIASLQAGRAKVQVRKEKEDGIAAKYARKAPNLAGFLENVATANSVQIPSSQDKKNPPIGKMYEERHTEVQFRKVGGYALLKTLEKIEKSGYPVSITRLSIRKRSTEHDQYDVNLGVSAFDRKDPKKSSAAGANSAGKKGDSP